MHHAIHTRTRYALSLILKGTRRIEATKKKERERREKDRGYVNARIRGEDSGPCNYLVFGPVNVQKEGMVVFLIE